jgi:hypothetical protein
MALASNGGFVAWQRTGAAGHQGKFMRRRLNVSNVTKTGR